MRFVRAAGLVALLAGLSLTARSAAQAPAEKAGTEKQKAFLRLIVPEKAKVEVEGVQTKQVGPIRRFESPPVEVGRSYKYLVKVTFEENGKETVREKDVKVQPGRETEVDFTKPDDPKKDETKKVEEKKVEGKQPEPPAPPKEEKKPEPKEQPAAKAGEDKENKEPQKVKLDVPYVPTEMKVVEAMLKLAAVKEGDTVIDLGCGDGRIVVTAVKQFKAGKGLGLDIDPERIKDSNKTAKDAGVTDKVTFRVGDVLKLTEADIKDADVVTLYLLPDINAKLKPLLQKALKPGARVVSHDFDMGDDWKAEKEETVTDSDGFDHKVFLWTIKK